MVTDLSSGALKTSIIVITFNGTCKIPRLLKSLEDLPERDWELLVIDDGSTDQPEQVIKNLDLKYSWRIIHQENKGRASAKNRGVRESVNELLWFLDDDMRVLPETLAAHLLHHRQHPGTICVGSQLEDEPLMKTDIQRYKCFISGQWKRQIESAPNPLCADDLYMTSANVTLSRSVYNRLDGFDERLRDAEDLDLVYRAFLESIPVYYNKAAVGYHMDLITCRSYIIRNRQYTMGYDILRNLNPHYMTINRRMHFSSPAGIKKILLDLISRPLFVNAIDHFNVFRLIPVKLRYRFYELLIFGLGRIFTDRKI